MRSITVHIRTIVVVSGLLLGGAMLPASAQPFGLVLAWERLYDGGEADDAVAVALDSAGNIHVIGNSGSPFGFQNWFLLTYDPAGNAVSVIHEDFRRVDTATGAATDGDGNIYVTGYTYDTVSSCSCVTKKYGALGPEWESFSTDPRAYRCLSAAWSESRGLYVAGAFASGAGDSVVIMNYDAFGHVAWSTEYSYPDAHIENVRIASDGGNGMYVAAITGDVVVTHRLERLDAAGNRIWARSYYGGTSAPHPIGLTVDQDYSTYLCVTLELHGTLLSIHVMKHDADGALLWEHFYGGPYQAEAAGITIDSLGQIYLLGHHLSPRNVREEVFVSKYSPAGVSSPVRVIGGKRSPIARSLEVDSGNRVYITSSVSGGDVDVAIAGYEAGVFAHVAELPFTACGSQGER